MPCLIGSSVSPVTEPWKEVVAVLWWVLVIFKFFVTDSSTTQHCFSLTSCSLLCQKNIGTRWQWCCSLTWYVREEGEIFQGMSEIGDSDIVRSCCANLTPLRNCIKNSLGTPCFMNARQFLVNLFPSFGRRELAFNAVSHWISCVYACFMSNAVFCPMMVCWFNISFR